MKTKWIFMMTAVAVLSIKTDASAQLSRAAKVRPTATVSPPAAAAASRPNTMSPAQKPSTVSSLRSSTPSTSSPRSSTASKPRTIHGNAIASEKPTDLYSIAQHRSGGRTSVYKNGVSSGRTSKNTNVPYRAVSQVNQLNAAAQKAGEKVTFSARKLATYDNRRLGLAAERQLTTKWDLKTGKRPPGNVLPRSYPFSRLPK